MLKYFCIAMAEKIKIFLVDDEADILEMHQYNLEKEGYEVFTTTNPDKVIPIALERKPDIFILDIMIPGTDGVQICEKIRERKEFEEAIIIFLTARSEDFTQIACYESGGDDFIIKPIKPKVLISRIKGLVRRIKKFQKSDTIRFKDVVIDLDKFEVRKNDKEVKLAKKEYELLLLLASRPGKLFSREEIFNKVWGVELMIGDRTIDVHIRKLREKLGDDLIKTIKGVGYKLNEVLA